MKALYNFEFDIAADAFREAGKANPGFALGILGRGDELQSSALGAAGGARRAQSCSSVFAPTAAARDREGAGAGKERELMESIEVLFGTGDKLARDIAYADALKAMHAEASGRRRNRVPLFAWRCSGPGRPGVSNTRNAMQAAAIAQGIFQRNPKHPGASIYIIHSFDDPDHAILGLPRPARHPGSRRRRRTRSHAVAHLRPARDVGRRRAHRTSSLTRPPAIWARRRKNLPRGREDFHTLGWLQ